MKFFAFLLALSVSIISSSGLRAEKGPTYGPELQGFDYPWPVQHFHFTSQGENLDMAHRDVKPKKLNGRAVVLLHGKNFCAATWQATITTLSDVGYRVIAPDQIGFCKSSKPTHYQIQFPAARGQYAQCFWLRLELAERL